MVEITKEDWKRAKAQFTALYVNDLIAMKAKKYMVELAEKEIKKFPEETEDEEMKAEIKKDLEL